MHRYAVLIATWFHVGKIPRAPGTWGTLAALPLVFLLQKLGVYWQLGGSLLLFPVAVWAAEAFESASGTHDSKEIVIDEVLGILITMALLPLTWQAYVAGFALFRVLDILKPFPIRYFDRNVKGGIGVVADDVVAGIIANAVLQIVFLKTDWLGIQWTGG